MNRTHLLIIDPQNDFCDLPQEWCPQNPTGERTVPSLAVPGAHRDLLRLAGWIERYAAHLEAITVTLDSHHRIDIAHPGFWKTHEGNPLPAYTQVSAAALRTQEFRTAHPEDAPRALAYLEALEACGKGHMVWPVHCQIGTWGQCVHAGLQVALDDWEDLQGRSVAQVHKGQNPWTEHFSALRAEVVDPDDPATGLNQDLLAALLASETVFVAGEAGSHCVRATVEHLAENWTGDFSRIILLCDAMSPVAGFESAQKEFLVAMEKRGLAVRSLAEAAASLSGKAV